MKDDHSIPDQSPGQAGSGRAGSAGKRRYVRFTRWRRRRFFALLEESGNVRMAAELAGVGLGAIYRLRGREAGFSERMAAAVAEASAGLIRADAKSVPPPRYARSPAATSGLLPGNPGAASGGRGDGAAPAKAGEDPDGLVIRRGIGGRLRVMAASNRWWQDRHDPIFLGHLAATGNVGASARAAGFSRKSAYNRRAALPDFAAGWAEALKLAEVHLNGRLVAEAHRGLAPIDEAAFDAADAAPFDPWLAIRLSQIWERKRAKRSREEE